MLDRGGFTGVHAAAMVHPGPVDVARAEPYAVAQTYSLRRQVCPRGGLP
jgi:hypothetical protein